VGVPLSPLGDVGAVQSGVRFRAIVHADGTVERWHTPRLPEWEVPRRDPSERRPLHPDVAEQRRMQQRGYRERQRARQRAEIAGLSAEGAALQSPIGGATP
jgi:hypothetical protein